MLEKSLQSTLTSMQVLATLSGFSTLYEKCGNLHITLYQKCCKYLLTSLLPLTVTVAGELVTAVEDANSGLLATQA